MLVLDHADRLHAAGHHGRHLLGDDPLRGHGDRLQPGAAEAVDGDPGGGNRQPGTNRRQAGHVLALGTLVEGGTEDHVLDHLGIKPSPIDGVADHVASQVQAVGIVQRAPVGLAQAGARG